MKEGEQWMKDTATFCIVVGALILTIMFAAAITVPGDNNQNTGLPMFLKKKVLMLFIISDSLSLFSLSTSVLMFLGVLTSRYVEDNLLKSLPTKMIISLSTLFFSIATVEMIGAQSVGKPKPFFHFSKRHVATPNEVMLGVRNNSYIQNGLYIHNTLQQFFLSIIERKRQKNVFGKNK